MERGMKIKHSVFSLCYKVWGKIFCETSLYGEDFLRQIYGGMFDMDANDQIMQGRKFARVKLVFHSLTLIWVIDILFEMLTPQIGN